MKRAPIWLLAGGPGSDKRQILKLLSYALSEARAATPSVAYLGSASGDDAGFFERIASLLTAAGAGRVTLAPTCGRRVRIAATRDILAEADIVFISGGDVEAGMATLNRLGLPPFLRSLRDAGTPFCGLSAGSIMLCPAWVRWPDANNDAFAEPFDCLGFSPLHCDTHSEEDDWEELKALLRLLRPGIPGYGIPPRGALRVAPDGRPEAFGDAVCRLELSPGGAYLRSNVAPLDRPRS